MSRPYLKDAQKILAIMRNLQNAQTYVEVDETSFSHLDLQAYRQIGDTLKTFGFEYLVDLELVELSTSATVLFKPTMVRVYTSADGYISVAHYQLKPRLDRLIPLLIKGVLNLRLLAAPLFFLSQLPTRNYFDVETEYDDGSFQLTSNASEAGHLSQAPTVHATYFSRTSNFETLLTHHKTELSKHLASGAKATVIKTLVQQRQMQHRLKQVKDAHRIAINWISEPEMHSLGSNKELSDALMEEVRRLLDEESRKTPSETNGT